jgi:hypothetical protein
MHSNGHRGYIDSKLSLRSPWVLVRKKGHREFVELKPVWRKAA